MKQSTFEYIIFTLLLAFSCFEYFFRETYLSWGVYLVAFLTLFFKKQKYNSQSAIPFIFIVSLWYCIQVLFVDRYMITTLVGQTVSLIGPFLVAIILKERFVKVFVTVIYWISVISLSIYFLSLIPGVKSFLMDSLAPNFVSLNVEAAVYEGGGANLIIYNFQSGQELEAIGLMRNSGPFWEPGMFAVFLNIALIFHNLIEKSGLKFCNAILITALITTFSTGGFLSGLVILVSYFLCKKQNILISLLGFALIIFVYYQLMELEYVGEKMLNQMRYDNVGSDTSRFGAFNTQIQMILNSPIVGGEDIAKYTSTKTLASGTLLPFVMLGIPCGLVFYYYMIKSFIRLAKSFDKNIWTGVCISVCFVILSFSQTILMTPVILTVIFVGLTRNVNHGKI